MARGPLLESWRAIHNLVIWTSPLTAEEVLERSTRNRLTLAYVDDELVGNATVRPPQADGTATVIVRVLPEHRRHGHGTSYFRAELDVALGLDARRIETVVLASNAEGLSFAQVNGFVEHDRYVLEGDEIAFVDLHLPPPLMLGGVHSTG